MAVRTQQVYFSTSLRVGPADRFHATLGVRFGLLEKLVASLINKEFGEKLKKLNNKRQFSILIHVNDLLTRLLGSY